MKHYHILFCFLFVTFASSYNTAKSQVDISDSLALVDLYNSTYSNFQEGVLAEIRRETYGEDIGQNSWITTGEFDTFYGWLNLSADDHVLEIASGSVY